MGSSISSAKLSRWIPQLKEKEFQAFSLEEQKQMKKDYKEAKAEADGYVGGKISDTFKEFVEVVQGMERFFFETVK